ncbi:MAG: hypothetical protein AAGC57_16345 [Pseudomonadota bacterium]
MAHFILNRLIPAICVVTLLAPFLVVAGVAALGADPVEIDERLAEGSPFAVRDLTHDGWALACFASGGTYYPSAEGKLWAACGDVGEATSPLGLIVIGDGGQCHRFSSDHSPLIPSQCVSSESHPELALLLTEAGIDLR